MMSTLNHSRKSDYAFDQSSKSFFSSSLESFSSAISELDMGDFDDLDDDYSYISRATIDAEEENVRMLRYELKLSASMMQEIGDQHAVQQEFELKTGLHRRNWLEVEPVALSSEANFFPSRPMAEEGPQRVQSSMRLGLKSTLRQHAFMFQ